MSPTTTAIPSRANGALRSFFSAVRSAAAMNGIKAIVPPETPGTLSASAMQKPWNAVKIMETTYFL